MNPNIVQKIGQISVPVKDVQKAVEFYKERLGLELLFQTETMAFFNCHGIRLLLGLPEKETYAQSSSVLYFQVNDIHESSARLKQNGVPFIDEPHVVAKMGNVETWMTFFNDTEGNTHALMSEVHVAQKYMHHYEEVFMNLNGVKIGIDEAVRLVER